MQSDAKRKKHRPSKDKHCKADSRYVNFRRLTHPCTAQSNEDELRRVRRLTEIVRAQYVRGREVPRQRVDVD